MDSSRFSRVGVFLRETRGTAVAPVEFVLKCLGARRARLLLLAAAVVIYAVAYLAIALTWPEQVPSTPRQETVAPVIQPLVHHPLNPLA